MADDFPSLAAAAAAPPSKKQTKKAKNNRVALDTFLEAQGLGGTGSWADEVEQMPSAPAPRDASVDWNDRQHLKDRDYPSREDHFDRTELPLPTQPPYTAYTGNLAYEASERDISDFFASSGCSQITSVRLVSDRDGKFKGFAYVEFGNVEDLKKAIAQSGAQLGGRAVRISVAEPPKSHASDANQWRRDGPLPDFGGDNRRQNSRGYSGGADRFSDDTDWSAARGSKFVPSERREFSSASTRSFGSGFGDAGQERGGFNSRYASAPGGADRGDSRRSSANYTPTEADTTSTWRRAGPPAASQEPAPVSVRKKLELTRSTNTSPPAAAAPSPSSNRPNPFGAAAPVDTAAREREVEAKRAEAQAERERLQREKAEEPKKILNRNEGSFFGRRETSGGGDTWRRGGPAPAAAAPAAPTRKTSPPASRQSKADAAKSVAREGFSFANAAAVLGASETGADDDAELAEQADKLKVDA